MTSTDPHAPTEQDGFRPRKKRTKADMKQLIKDGVVADPDNPQPEPIPRDGAHIVQPPAATLDGGGKE